jgi:hypothetical protein
MREICAVGGLCTPRCTGKAETCPAYYREFDTFYFIDGRKVDKDVGQKSGRPRTSNANSLQKLDGRAKRSRD